MVDSTRNIQFQKHYSFYHAMIPVTAAIIERDGLILAARRGPNLHLSGYWEFPGGKIEGGESHKECLKRELNEEFSIECEIGKYVGKSTYDYGHKVIQLFGYYAKHLAGSFQLTDHDKICWLPVNELSSLEWAPADIPFVEILQHTAIAEKNLAFYETNTQRYVEETRPFDMHLLQQKFVNLLPDKAHILDLGCGSGRDSRVFLDLGYKVTATDGSTEIARTTSAYLDRSVLVQRIQDLDVTKTYNGIWASASLLHIPKSETIQVYLSIISALKPGGILYMSYKHGENERWDASGRFFNNYSKNSMNNLLGRLPHIEVLEVTEQTATLRGQPQNWLNVFIRKP